MYLPSEGLYGAIGAAALSFLFRPGNPLANKPLRPLTTREQRSGRFDIAALTLINMINGSFPASRTAEAWTLTEGDTWPNACAQAESRYAKIFAKMAAQPSTTPDCSYITHNNQVVAIRKIQDQGESTLSLAELTILGPRDTEGRRSQITYPAGSLFYTKPSGESNDFYMRRRLYRGKAHDIGEIESANFVRLTAFALAPLTRPTVFSNCFDEVESSNRLKDVATYGAMMSPIETLQAIAQRSYEASLVQVDAT